MKRNLVLGIGLVCCLLLFSIQFPWADVRLDQFWIDTQQIHWNTTTSIHDKQYLLAIVGSGMNNQIYELNSAAILARRLKRVLVIPDLLSHPSNPVKARFNSQLLLQVDPNNQNGLEYMFQSEFEELFANQVVSGPNIVEKKPRTPNLLPDMSEHNVSLKITKVVLLNRQLVSVKHGEMVYANFNKFIHNEFVFAFVYKLYNDLPSLTGRNRRAYQTISFQPWIYQVARELANNSLSSNFVCAHVRSYSDKKRCFATWGSNLDHNHKSCDNRLMLPREMKHNINSAMDACNFKHGNCTLFVPYHPKMKQTNVKKMCEPHSPIFMKQVLSGNPQLRDLLNSHIPIKKGKIHNDLLSIIEQSICILSDYFVQSPLSSWSQYARLLRISQAKNAQEAEERMF